MHKTRITQMVKFSLQTRWTLLVIIVPCHTKNRTGKHTVYIYSDGIDLQKAQELQQSTKKKSATYTHLQTPPEQERVNMRSRVSTSRNPLYTCTDIRPHPHLTQNSSFLSSQSGANLQRNPNTHQPRSRHRKDCAA